MSSTPTFIQVEIDQFQKPTPPTKKPPIARRLETSPKVLAPHTPEQLREREAKAQARREVRILPRYFAP